MCQIRLILGSSFLLNSILIQILTAQTSTTLSTTLVNMGLRQVKDTCRISKASLWWSIILSKRSLNLQRINITCQCSAAAWLTTRSSTITMHWPGEKSPPISAWFYSSNTSLQFRTQVAMARSLQWLPDKSLTSATCNKIRHLST